MNVEEVVLLNKIDKKLDKTPSVGDFDRICRICLRTLITNEHKPIQDEHFKMSIKSLLETYTFVKIPEETDPLPQSVCTNCIKFLVEIHTFRCKRMVNEDVLKKVIKKYNKDVRESLAMHDYANANANSEDSQTVPPEILNGQMEIPLLPEVDTPATSQPLVWLSRELSDEKLGIFKCRDCQAELPDRASLLHHRKEAQHWKNAATQCPQCGKFVNRSRLIHHMKTHTQEKPFQCELCSMRTTTKQHLKRHMLIHTGEKPFTCNICGRGFRQAYALQSHKTVHGEVFEAQRRVLRFDNIICQICQQGYENASKYIEHMREEHDVNQLDSNKIENSDTKLEIYQCPMPDCGDQFVGEEALNQHLASLHKSYACNVCGKCFKSKTNLKTHMWVHTGEKLYKCEVCEKNFVQYSALVMHMHIHNGVKRYTCKICLRPFRQPNHLKHHMRTHTGEKPYKCEYCGRSFALNGNLTVHKRTHTGETPYHCRVCDKGFIDSTSLKKHERSHVQYDAQVVNQELVSSKEEIVEEMQTVLEHEIHEDIEHEIHQNIEHEIEEGIIEHEMEEGIIEHDVVEGIEHEIEEHEIEGVVHHEIEGEIVHEIVDGNIIEHEITDGMEHEIVEGMEHEIEGDYTHEIEEEMEDEVEIQEEIQYHVEEVADIGEVDEEGQAVSFIMHDLGNGEKQYYVTEYKQEP